MDISIVIPTLNEAKNIGPLIHHLQTNGGDALAEIIVVDGGSTDDTVAIAEGAGAVIFQTPKPGRALQMNYGAERALGKILYFVHADTLPPASFVEDILVAFDTNFPIGCFRIRFDSDRPLLKINAWFTRFDLHWCRGGDQSLYVIREIFYELKGFCDGHMIMEEYDFMARAKKIYPFKIIPKDILVSARKYETNGYMRVQIANLTAFNMYRLGFPQKRIYNTYKRMLDYR